MSRRFVSSPSTRVADRSGRGSSGSTTAVRGCFGQSRARRGWHSRFGRSPRQLLGPRRRGKRGASWSSQSTAMHGGASLGADIAARAEREGESELGREQVREQVGAGARARVALLSARGTRRAAQGHGGMEAWRQCRPLSPQGRRTFCREPPACSFYSFQPKPLGFWGKIN